jgi:hypothetical protein
MGLSNAERQARWRAKRDAEIERLRKAGGVQPPELDNIMKVMLQQELEKAQRKIERLGASNTKLQRELHHSRSMSNRYGVMSRANFKKILACLHPDYNPSKEAKQRNAEIFNFFGGLADRLVKSEVEPPQPPAQPKAKGAQRKAGMPPPLNL